MSWWQTAVVWLAYGVDIIALGCILFIAVGVVYEIATFMLGRRS